MRILPSSTSSEHWLTLMTCTVCAHTPDNSPVYKCNLGHTVCYPCFQKLVNSGIPMCNICDSDKFTRQDVSSDFLHKLKYKPGIGRPRRYVFDPIEQINKTLYSNNEESVTVEKLFQMSASKIQQLFDESTKDKLRQMNSISMNGGINVGNYSRPNLKNEIRDEEVSTVQTLADKSSKIWLRKTPKDDSRSILNLDNSANNVLQSRKPLKCPHDPCHKIIAVSSFQSHFKYEHCEFQRYSLEKGNELVLVFNPAIIQHDRNLCLAIIKLVENVPDSTPGINKKLLRKREIDTFWVMVSGSPDDRPKHGYAIFWLFTNNDDRYNCTMELSSHKDMMMCTTFCGVNGIHESQNISEVVQRLNCLFLTHGTLRTMLTYGPMMKLRITIH